MIEKLERLLIYYEYLLKKRKLASWAGRYMMAEDITAIIERIKKVLLKHNYTI